MLNYHVEGKGEAVVLIHGVGGDLGNWDAIAAQLASARKVIRVDLRGHGKSQVIRSPLTAEDLARDVVEVMDEAGVEAGAVAGFSLGGQVALALALGWPARVRRLALISTVCGRTPTERARRITRSDWKN